MLLRPLTAARPSGLFAPEGGLDAKRGGSLRSPLFTDLAERTCPPNFIEWDQLPNRLKQAVNWLGFARWSSEPALAASHLQGPETFATQSDHLLSLVRI
jgi:hypothetical protein